MAKKKTQRKVSTTADVHVCLPGPRTASTTRRHGGKHKSPKPGKNPRGQVMTPDPRTGRLHKPTD